MKKIVISISLCFLTSCASYYYDMNVNDIKERASFEMNCSKDKLTVVPLKKSYNGAVTEMGVEGCGKKGVYVLILQTGQWVLNSTTN
jgi:hypothetical protein